MEDSELIYNRQVVGFATGGLEVDVPGTDGMIQVYSNISNNNHVPQTMGKQALSWDTTSSWVSAGDIHVLSQFYVRNGINWNATGVFQYGDNKYKIGAEENNYGMHNDEFLVYGVGGYGGNLNNW